MGTSSSSPGAAAGGVSAAGASRTGTSCRLGSSSRGMLRKEAVSMYAGRSTRSSSTSSWLRRDLHRNSAVDAKSESSVCA